jgi:hypothetical protein
MWNISLSNQGWADIEKELNKKPYEWLRRAYNSYVKYKGKFSSQLRFNNILYKSDLVRLCKDAIRDTNSCKDGAFIYFIDKEGDFTCDLTNRERNNFHIVDDWFASSLINRDLHKGSPLQYLPFKVVEIREIDGKLFELVYRLPHIQDEDQFYTMLITQKNLERLCEVGNVQFTEYRGTAAIAVYILPAA